MAKKIQRGAPTAIRDAPQIFVPTTRQVLGPPDKVARPGLPSPRGTFEYPASTPVHLTASVTLESSSSGGVNTLSLKNPVGAPMEILEIKFQLRTVGTVGTILGGAIACKLDLGRYPVTNGFVPVWSFGRRENEIETYFQTPLPEDQGTQEFSWRLPKPLYVPAGAILVPTFQHRGLIQEQVTARISYSGRTLPPGQPAPRRVAIPYVSVYSSKTMNANDADTDQSDENDLINPFTEPLHLQRLIGRLQIFRSNLDTASEQGFADTVGFTLLNTRISDMNGRPILRDFTPFRMAFDALSRSWEMDNFAVLDPRSFLVVYLRKDAPATPASTQIFVQSFISAVGWRDVVGGEAKT